MSRITSEVVALLARVWHRIDLSEAEASGIAKFLAPIDEVAEKASARLDFDSEPADFHRAMEALAHDE